MTLSLPISLPPSLLESKAFFKKQLLVKYTPLEEATKAVTDIVILSSFRKAAPPHYHKLG